MKMTRKILAMLLAMAMVLSLAACGNQSTPANNDGDADSVEPISKVTLQVAYENNPGEPIDDAVKEWQRHHRAAAVPLQPAGFQVRPDGPDRHG